VNLQKLILLIVVTVLILSVAYADTINPISDALDGSCEARNGSANNCTTTLMEVGSNSFGSLFEWERTFLKFDLNGLSTVSVATFNIFYQGTSIEGSGDTWDANVALVEDIGNTLDTGDYFNATLFTIDESWFDQDLTSNLTIDITDAWNDSIKEGRNFLVIRIAMNDEPSHTSGDDTQFVQLCDTGSSSGSCSPPGSNPSIDFTPTRFAVTGSARTMLSLVPLMGGVVVIFLALGFFVLGRKSETVGEQLVRFQDVVFSVVVTMFLFTILTVITNTMLAVTV